MMLSASLHLFSLRSRDMYAHTDAGLRGWGLIDAGGERCRCADAMAW